MQDTWKTHSGQFCNQKIPTLGAWQRLFTTDAYKR